jgi:nitrogen fixation/metabolism regulation signal transduction histidine kinase
MKELSLNILDIAENSVKANATLVEIIVRETTDELTIIIKDDGFGMSKDTVEAVTNPFYTTRTTRKVGLGIPLLKLSAEQTGGYLEIVSKVSYPEDLSHGTTVTAHFIKSHIDFTPLGDVTATVITLIQGHPDTDFYFKHEVADEEVTLDTRALREILADIPLNTYEVIKWIEENLTEQYEVLKK